jgi:hypothetical protein
MTKPENRKSVSAHKSAPENVSLFADFAKSVRGRILLLLLAGSGVTLGALKLPETEVPQTVSDWLTEDEWDDQLRKAVSELEGRYHLRIVFSKVGKSGLENKKEALKTLSDALGKYPVEMFIGLNLEIKMEAWLSNAAKGDSVPRYTGGYSKNGEAVHDGNIIRLNSAPFGDSFRFDELTVHHEVSHCFLNEERFRRFAGEHEDRNNLSYEWAMLYQSHGFRAKKGQGFFESGRPEGYAIRYGLQSTEEDVATVAHRMFMEPLELMDLCKEDSVLNLKVGLLRRYYSKWSNGQMDDQYWKDLAEGKVDAEYWVRRKEGR